LHSSLVKPSNYVQNVVLISSLHKAEYNYPNYILFVDSDKISSDFRYAEGLSNPALAQKKYFI